ncbi:NRAMP (natural resistance-associated macrophage protein) metal ion transporters [Nakamurella panacisegetis]|uniref:NRAMP (Natural resistance-associated macrophage protein) metal ion transporters n=1 Tax=Nakamurella panacisegetis TaxID=1090615 RepID=A0A1H0RHN3_9ACTN|nr:Nramp family divalent metal transporter [Nakamurella panacisegetis]SDP29072.1 NRAMP (natural resistance-associated macrophage protein) metal ion transporters [Nakamurella panacisegetis]
MPDAADSSAELVPAAAGKGDAEGSQLRSEVDLTQGPHRTGWRYYLRAIGPGLVTGASDDDPSGVATYSQAGAAQGYGMLWVSLVTFPLMAAVQEICDRTALATGKSLGELVVIRWRSRPARIFFGALLIGLLAANALNIAADLVAVGSGMTLLHAGPTWLWALVAGVATTALVMFGSFARIALVFKVLCAALLVYFVVAILVHPPAGQVLRGTFVPQMQLNPTYLTLLVAVLGTTISPYLFFWQSAHRLEDMRDEPEQGRRAVPLAERDSSKSRRKLRASRLDVIAGMAFNNLVMFAIIVSTSATLHAHGTTNLNSAADAAKALEPLAGRWAGALFALGFIGSGMLAIPVLAGAGAAGMAGLLGRRFGFSRSVRQAPVFYGLVAVGTLGGTALTLAHVDPVQLLVISAYINGVAAAPFLLLVMLISSSRTIMGPHRNGRIATTLGWATMVPMTTAAITSFIVGG